MKLYHGTELVGEITTNHSMSIDDALELLNIDVDEMDGGDPKWDYEAFRMDWDD